MVARRCACGTRGDACVRRARMRGDVYCLALGHSVCHGSRRHHQGQHRVKRAVASLAAVVREFNVTEILWRVWRLSALHDPPFRQVRGPKVRAEEESAEQPRGGVRAQTERVLARLSHERHPSQLAR
eukprot:CAMPEP_0206156706 /NCGR_PEP_ID=MMETSP1474-20131121/3217_1 /ASSEMBLY_ACC=CAM_ASM_001110 /TAXON_ID=97495 /ORGANISM="Imantonia sp., Strain RCC918" /LENGTH=126 /DNA_ID=CAMNT_0053555895 /DNA_START=116 /DNA_END=496 /DNA_ORIENTATION=+